MFFVEHLDEGVEVVEIGLVLGDGELSDRHHFGLALSLLLAHTA